jgi:hypothetical protein
MLAALHTFALAIVLIDPVLAFAQDSCHEKTTPECVARQKENSRKAVDHGLATARALPAKGASEIERKRELVQKIEALIAERRRAGADECRTWTEVMGIAFNQ